MATDEFYNLLGDIGDVKPDESNIYDLQPFIALLIQKISDHTDAEIKRYDEEIKKKRESNAYI